MKRHVVGLVSEFLSWLVFAHILLWLVVSFWSGDPIQFQRAGTVGIAGAIITWALVRWTLLENNPTLEDENDKRRLVGIALKYEVAVVVLATLQTGYGDLIMKFFRCGDGQC